MRLHDLSALEQAAAIHRGEASSTELVEHYLARINAFGERVGAFVTVTPARARAAAAAADPPAHQPSGHTRRGGPFLGVPIAIKDLTATAGVRTTFGSAAFADFIPSVDADVVTLLRAAGTVSLGKTTTSELGCSLYSEGEVAPPARNPWDTQFTAGGSSGGAAAAVAAGLVPFAQGSDGGGSIRIPAAICGLVGYKPSRGLVSGGPAGFGAFGLTTPGPITRTVADAAAMLDAISVPMPGEPYPRPTGPAGGYLEAVEAAAPGPLRVGRFTAPLLAETAVHPDCLAAVDITAKALEAAGHEVVEVPAPFSPGEVAPLFEMVWYTLATTPVPPEHEADLLPLTRWLRARAARLSAVDLVRGLTQLQDRVRRALRPLTFVDLLLSPTLARPQAPVGWFTQTGDPADDFTRQKEFSPYCSAYNVTGQPAITLPVGQTSGDARPMPVGAMLAAPVGDDARLLAVAAQVEQAVGWRDRHPAVWSEAPSATVNGV